MVTVVTWSLRDMVTLFNIEMDLMPFFNKCTRVKKLLREVRIIDKNIIDEKWKKLWKAA